MNPFVEGNSREKFISFNIEEFQALKRGNQNQTAPLDSN